MDLRRIAGLLVVATVFLAAPSCASLEGPAKTVVDKVERAWASVRADAAEYAPEAIDSVDKALADAKAALARGDYGKVVDAGKRLLSEIDGLKAKIASAKAEAAKGWDAAVAEVPGRIEAAKARAEALSRAAQLPPGLTKDALKAGKAAIAEAEAAWNDAVRRVRDGAWKDAMDRAAAAKKRVAKAMADLGMNDPEAR